MLTPLLNILAATGRNAESVMQEVGQIRAGWLACDYRSWLKAYNPDVKRQKISTGMCSWGKQPAEGLSCASMGSIMSAVRRLDTTISGWVETSIKWQQQGQRQLPCGNG